MYKRSEFLGFLKRAKVRARVFGRQHQEGPARESLCEVGLALPGDTREFNPILQVVIEAAFGTEDFLVLREAEERAWEYYEEREKGNRGTTPGFVPPHQASSAGTPEQDHEIQASVNSDHGYGYGV